MNMKNKVRELRRYMTNTTLSVLVYPDRLTLTPSVTLPGEDAAELAESSGNLSSASTPERFQPGWNLRIALHKLGRAANMYRNFVNKRNVRNRYVS